MNYRWRIFCILLVLTLAGVVWLYWRQGGFMNINGTLLCSLEGRNPFVSGETPIDATSSISAISFNYAMKIENYFQNNKYGNLDFPCKRENDFICVAWNLENGYYAVLQVKDNNTTELMTAKAKISYPLLINGDQEILFIGGDQDKAYLFKYDRQTNKLLKLYDKPLDAESRPLVLHDGSIIITVLDKYKLGEKFLSLKNSIIVKLHPDGTVEELVQGRYPVWLEEGRSFIYYQYYEDAGLMVYDIISRKKRLILKHVTIRSQPVVSPDKEHIAFDELNDTTHIRFKIMSVDGWCKKDISLYKKSSFRVHQCDWYK